MEEPNSTEYSFVNQLSDLLSAYANILMNIVGLAVTEAKLACESLVKILYLKFALFLILISSWFFLLAAIYCWVHLLGLNYSESFIVIFFINMTTAFIIYILINYYKKDLKFNATHRQLKLIRKKHE